MSKVHHCLRLRVGLIGVTPNPRLRLCSGVVHSLHATQASEVHNVSASLTSRQEWHYADAFAMQTTCNFATAKPNVASLSHGQATLHVTSSNYLMESNLGIQVVHLAILHRSALVQRQAHNQHTYKHTIIRTQPATAKRVSRSCRMSTPLCMWPPRHARQVACLDGAGKVGAGRDAVTAHLVVRGAPPRDHRHHRVLAQRLLRRRHRRLQS